MWSGTGSPGLGCNGPGTSLHVCTSVALIRADSAISSGCGCFTTAGRMGECGGALEFAEDGFFVGEEVAHKSIGVLFVEG